MGPDFKKVFRTSKLQRNYQRHKRQRTQEILCHVTVLPGISPELIFSRDWKLRFQNHEACLFKRSKELLPR